MKNKRIIALAASLGLAALAVTPMCASAGNYRTEDQASGGTTKIDKYLVLDTNATVPNISTQFSITSGEGIEDGVNGVPCYAGIGTPKFLPDAGEDITVTEAGKAVITFEPTDATTPEKSANTKTVTFKTTNDTDEKFAIKSLTISFEDIRFPEPGLYRYIITEDVPTDGGISIPTGSSREYTLFVTVESNDQGKLVVAQTKYVLQEGTAAPEFEEKTLEDSTKVQVNSKKKTGFTNWYKTHDLMFNKLVQGNQGSRDKYFKFTVKLTNPTGDDALTMTEARANDRFFVRGSFDPVPENNSATNADYKTPATEGADSPMKIANNNELGSMTEGADTHSYITYSQLLAGKDFYLHSGQNIEIYGIPEGLGYEVSEVREGYTASVSVHDDEGLDSDGTKSDENTKVTDSKLTATARLTFTNTKGGVIPTGILNTVAGSLGIAAVGAAGIAGGFVLLKKKKSGEDSES